MDDEIKRRLMTELHVPLWPIGCKAIGVGRTTGLKMFANGEIPGAYRAGKRKIICPTAPLRRRLGIEEAA